jgi:hypothetical protein
MDEKIVFKRKPSMQVVLIFFAVGTAFAGYIFISVLKLKSQITWTLWAITAIPVIVLILLQLFHTIVITPKGIVKGILQKKMEFSGIVRFGEGILEKRFRDSDSYNTARTYHILLLDKKGKKLRVNWMGYKNGDELRKLLVQGIGHGPEKLRSGFINALYFNPVLVCPECGHDHKTPVSRCKNCGVYLMPG